jgi:hypothetical protein
MVRFPLLHVRRGIVCGSPTAAAGMAVSVPALFPENLHLPDAISCRRVDIWKKSIIFALFP